MKGATRLAAAIFLARLRRSVLFVLIKRVSVCGPARSGRLIQRHGRYRLWANVAPKGRSRQSHPPQCAIGLRHAYARLLPSVGTVVWLLHLRGARTRALPEPADPPMMICSPFSTGVFRLFPLGAEGFAFAAYVSFGGDSRNTPRTHRAARNGRGCRVSDRQAKDGCSFCARTSGRVAR
jgi:hypothetical protein